MIKRLFFAILATILFLGTANAATVYYRQALTGGGATALDAQDGAALADKDLAIVSDLTDVYFYQLDDDSAAAESSPDVISPDTNAGNKRWILQNVYSVTSGVNPPSGTAGSMTGGVVGMMLSNDTDTDHDINVTKGASMDSTGVYHISLDSEITKRIDAAWSAGDDSGGLLNGSVSTSTLYHVYLLRKNADATGDIGFLALGDSIATYKPTGYDYYRWVGFVLTDSSSNIIPFYHTGDGWIDFDTHTLLIIDDTTGTVTQDITAYVPDNRTSEILISGYDTAAGSGYALSAGVNDSNWYSQMARTTTTSGFSPDVYYSLITRVRPNGQFRTYVASRTVDIYLKAVKIFR